MIAQTVTAIGDDETWALGDLNDCAALLGTTAGEWRSSENASD
jgi:hypothetical protein